MQQVTVQIVIFTIFQGNLNILSSYGELPGQKLSSGQSVEKAANNLFENAVNISPSRVFSEQLFTFSFPNQAEIVVGYYYLVPFQLITKIKSGDSLIAQDNFKNKEDRDVVNYAVQRLRWKVEYTNAVYSLLPNEFTLSELQATYEAILGRNLDKRNFRKKILSLGLIKSIGKKKRGVAARPAEIYTFKTRKPVMVKVFS